MDIKQTAIQIRSSVMNNKSLDIADFKDFKTQYPKLFSMLLNPNMDIDMLEHLFVNLEQLQQGKLDSISAASAFSKHGAEKYVYPTVGTPSSSQLHSALHTIKKKYK